MQTHAYNSHAAENTFEARFAAAEEARQSGELQKAYDLLGALINEAPDNEKVNFAYGMTCLNMGESSRAELAFQRVLQINPNNHRARLELARALVASERYAEARMEAEKVLSQNPPPQVKENIKTFLSSIRRRESRSRPYRLRLEAGAFYDSNVNVGPDPDIITINPITSGLIEFDKLEIGDESKPREDSGMFFSVRGSRGFDPGEKDAWRTELGAFYYQNEFQDENDYRISYFQFHGALQNISGAHQWQFPLRYSHINHGGNSLVDSVSISSTYSYVFPEAGQRLSAIADMQLRDYANRSDRDGVYALGGISFDQFFGRRRNVLSMRVTTYHDFTDEAIYEYSGIKWSINGTLNLPFSSALYAQVNYSANNYRARETLAPKRREDTQTQAVLGLRKQFFERFGLDLNHQITRNESTFGLYEYSRNITTVSTSYAF